MSIFTLQQCVVGFIRAAKTDQIVQRQYFAEELRKHHGFTEAQLTEMFELTLSEQAPMNLHVSFDVKLLKGDKP